MGWPSRSRNLVCGRGRDRHSAPPGLRGGARALRGVSVLSETVLFLLHYSTQRTLTGEPSNPTALLRATKPNGPLQGHQLEEMQKKLCTHC